MNRLEYTDNLEQMTETPSVVETKAKTRARGPFLFDPHSAKSHKGGQNPQSSKSLKKMPSAIVGLVPAGRGKGKIYG